MLHQGARRRAIHQRLQALQRHVHLAVVGHELAEHARDLRQPADVGNEQREVTDGEAPVAHRPRRQQQQHPGAEIGDVGRRRAHELGEDAIGQDRVAPLLIQLAQVRDDVLLGVGHLDGLGRAEHLAEQTGHVADRLLRRGAERPNARVRHPHDGDDDEQWRQDGQGEPWIDAQQGGDGQSSDDCLADRVEHPAQAHHHGLDVVAKTADRFAGGGWQRLRARLAQNVVERVVS